MAAQPGDKFKKVGASTVTSLAAPGKAIGATSITVGSTTNYPLDTGVVVAIRVVDTAGALVSGTYTEWNAIVTSATSLTLDPTPAYGSDQVYAAGSSTQVYISVAANAHNQMVDGLLVAHDQDGTLKAGAVDNAAVLADDVVETAKIKDGAVSTAKLADAAVTNAKLSTTAGELGGAWQSWTPTFTNFTKGSATVVAKYIQVGKTVNFRLSITLSGSTMGTGPTFTLPVTAVTYPGPGVTQNIGISSYIDTGTAQYRGEVVIASTTTATLQSLASSGTYLGPSQITASSPHTWANTDIIYAQGTYEAA